MPVPTKEWVEAQSGVDGLRGIFFRDFAWPIPDEDSDIYWGIKVKEPYVRHECHLDDRVIVYALPTKEAWPLAGFPVVFLRSFDRAMTQAEVDDYREAMYGVKDKPPVRPAKAPGTAAKKPRKRRAKKVEAKA